MSTLVLVPAPDAGVEIEVELGSEFEVDVEVNVEVGTDDEISGEGGPKFELGVDVELLDLGCLISSSALTSRSSCSLN